MASFPKAGPRGLEGPIGPAGPQGIEGPVGPEGPQGPDGEGTVGAEGPQGPVGPQGNVGPAGPQGNAGPEGLKGATGAQGVKGDTGATGAQGVKGDTGATGPIGPEGPKGSTGATGPIGPEGPKGATGATGPEPTTMPESGVVNLSSHLDRLFRSGLNAKEFPALSSPQLAGVGTAQITTTRAVRGVRFIPWRNMIVRGLSFPVSAVASKNDECAVLLLDTNGKTVLAKSTAQTGLLTSTGRKDVDFTADVELVADHIYYACFQYGTVLETGATFGSYNFNIVQLQNMIGSGAGEALSINSTPGTFPATEVTTPLFTATTAPWLIVRER